MRLAVPGLLLLVLAWSMGACAGPGGAAPPAGSATQTPAVPGAAIDACELLSDAEISAATGQGVVQRQTSALRPDVFPSICDIELDGGGSLTVSLRTSGGRSMYENSFEAFIGQDGYLDEAVAGLGDKAGRVSQDTLMVLKGDTLFEIQMSGFGREDRLATVRYLAEVALAKLDCLAAGCPGFSPPPPPATAPAVDACAWLTYAEIEGTTGYPVLESEPASGLGGDPICTWTVNADPSLLGLYSFMLTVKDSGGREQFDFWADAFEPPLQHVPGLGDDAIQTATVPGGHIYVVVGDRLVTLSFSMPLSVDDPYALLRPLLEIALGRI